MPKRRPKAAETAPGEIPAFDFLLRYMKETKDVPGLIRLFEFWFQFQRIRGSVASVLDAGCGRGIKSLYLALNNPRLEIRGIDGDEQSLRHARREAEGRKNVAFSKHNLSDGLPEKTYDLILLSDVLEHIKEDTDLVQRIRGCLSENGLVYVSVPAVQHEYGYDSLDEAGKEDLWNWARTTGHVRLGYEPEELRAVFHGYRQITLRKAGNCVSETAYFLWEKAYLRWNVPEERVRFHRRWLEQLYRSIETYGAERYWVDPQPPLIEERILKNILRSVYISAKLEDEGFFQGQSLAETHVVGLFQKREE